MTQPETLPIQEVKAYLPSEAHLNLEPTTMDGETWLPLTGYKQLYHISSYGRLCRFDKSNNPSKVYKLHIAKGGYATIIIDDTTLRVDLLVAKCFIPNPAELPDITHTNGICEDNRTDNLEWCERSSDLLLMPHVSGLSKVRKKINGVPVVKLGANNERLNAYTSVKEACKDNGIPDYDVLMDVCKGKTDSCAGHKWSTLIQYLHSNERFLTQKAFIPENRKGISIL